MLSDFNLSVCSPLSSFESLFGNKSKSLMENSFAKISMENSIDIDKTTKTVAMQLNVIIKLENDTMSIL